MVREQLKRIGLTDEEINIYTFLLKRGSSKATIISKELGTARTTVYRFLSSLFEKGLIGENIQNNVKYFYPIEPERIPEIMQEKIKEIETIIPQLQEMKNEKFEETNTELFKGREGMKSIMKDILRTKKPYTFIGETEKYFSEIEIFTIQWLKQVEDNKMKGRLLCSEKQNFKVAKTEEYRLLPKELISNISTWTYGDKTALFIWLEPFYAVVINNKSVTENNRKTFDYLWKISKRPSKKHLAKTRI